MNYYHFKTNRDIRRDSMQSYLESVLDQEFELQMVNPQQGVIISETSIIAQLTLTIGVMQTDLNILIIIVSAHCDDKFVRDCCLFAYENIISSCLRIDEVILLAWRQDHELVKRFREYFNRIDDELLQTIKVYLLCGNVGNMAAEQLYIHRNTLLYRLTQFVSQTGLDPRNLEHLPLIQLWFTMCNINNCA